ncbi:MAG TPA: hypothetical protein VGM84_20110 [Steroidobacteraceae bacterium]|jgi:Spy/CpxP family protein refolding chaperone
MKSSLFAALLLSVAGAAAAQAPSFANGHPNAAAFEAKRMDRMAILLDLNDGQKAAVQTILDEERAKAQAQFTQFKSSGTRPTPQQMKALRDQLKAETLQKLTPVLTADQLKKFQVLEPQGPGRRWHHGPPPPPPAN